MQIVCRKGTSTKMQKNLVGRSLFLPTAPSNGARYLDEFGEQH